MEDNSIIANPIHYFINYEGRYEDYVSICSRIKREIRTNQIEGGMVGIFNPSITQRLNGLTEKSEVDATVKVTSLPVEVKSSPELPTDEK